MAKTKKVEVLTLEEKLQQALVPQEEQPYKVPDNWCWSILGCICYFERGITFPASAKEKTINDNNIPCLRTANIQDELEIRDLIYVNKSYIKNNEAKLVRKNDIIMSSANSRELVGKTSYVATLPFPMTFGGFLVAIRPKNILNKYLFYFFRLEFLFGHFMGESTQTTNIANINIKILGDYKIPLPPLPEQQRIVDRVESLFAKLDEAKEKAQEVIDGFEERKAAILHKAFTGELTAKWRAEHGIGMDSWEEVKIEDIGEVRGGKRVPKGMNLIDKDNGHPYLKAKNLKCGTVIESEIMYVPEDVLKYIQKYTVSSGDVYITNVGACIGDCGIIPEEYDGANLTENAVKITNLKMNNKFLYYILSSNTVQQIIKQSIASATLGKLSILKIKKISFYMPKSVHEQEYIVYLVSDLIKKEHKAKEAAESVLEQVDLIKKSILAKAFRGELGTNNPEEESAVELLKACLQEQ